MKKIKPNDLGQLKIAITVKNNHLIIDFGKDISWIGFHKEETEQLIKVLKDKLKEFDKGR